MNNNSKITILFILFIVFEVFMYLLIREMHEIDPRIIIFDIRIFYSPDLYISNTALYTTYIEGYLLIFRMTDMIFPFIYSLLLIQILKKLKSSSFIFPILSLIFDLLENTILTFLNYGVFSSIDYYIYLVNIVTLLKFLTIFITLGIIVYLAYKGKRLKH